MPDTPDITFVLPTYNEVENIGRLIDGLAANAGGRSCEFLVVDDNSPDGTAKLIEKKGKADPRIKLHLRTANPGLTVSLQEGIEKATGTLVSWMDCDLSMPPEDVPRLLKAIDDGADAAIGSRFVKGGGVELIEGGPDSFLGYALSRILNTWTIWILGSHVRDHTSGFIVAKKEVLEKFPLQGDYGEYFIRLMYRMHKAGHRIDELPYLCRSRVHGESKTGSSFLTYAKRGWKYLATVIGLRLRG
jgi:dolichol-phosphate mannosyltransferase